MKSLLTLFLIFFSLLIGFSQTDDTNNTANTTTSIDKNELRLNVLNFLAFNRFEADYEHLFSPESSFGLTTGVSLGNRDEFFEVTTFVFTPYYRKYFTKKYAKGFFVEGFASVLTREDDFFDSVSQQSRKQTDLALGISVGGKFLTLGGFVAEVFAGIGRTLGGGSNDEASFNNIIGRGGISIGYRF